MKHLYSLLLLLCITVLTMAQTQRGYVRTIGRSNNPGRPVSGVSIKVDGPYSMVLSGEDGLYVLSLSGLKIGDAFRFASVKKNGYDLLDQYTIGRDYSLSSKVAVEIVLVNRAEKEAEKARIAERFQAQAQARYEAQLRTLEAQNLSSQEKYKQSQSYEEMLNRVLDQIDAQAEYYATRDYDQMDSLDMVITHHIEQGEFDEAELLIKSKGSIEDRIRAVQTANQSADEAAEAAAKMQQLAEAKAEDAARQQANVEQDLMNLFQMAKASYQNDTAYYYLNKLLELSPENPIYLMESGDFVREIYSQYAQALEYYQRALSIYRNLYGEEHANVAVCYYNMGTAHYPLGQFDKSLMYAQKALDIRLKLFGDEHVKVANCYNCIGADYSALSQYDKAGEYCQRALTMLQKLLGEEHEEVAMCYHNLGDIYRKMSQFNRALEYHQMALSIFKKLYGEDHAYVAMCYRNMGVIYERLAQYDQAIECQKKAESIYKKVYGEEHAFVGECYYNMGVVYCRLTQFDRAKELVQKALSIFLTIYGEEYPDVSACYVALCLINIYTGQYDAAIEMNDKAIAITHTPELIDNKGEIYYVKGDYQAAYDVWVQLHAEFPDFPQQAWAQEVEKMFEK